MIIDNITDDMEIFKEGDVVFEKDGLGYKLDNVYSGLNGDIIQFIQLDGDIVMRNITADAR